MLIEEIVSAVVLELHSRHKHVRFLYEPSHEIMSVLVDPSSTSILHVCEQ